MKKKMEKPENHLSILLDIQKQLGDLKAESTGQSQMLISLDSRVAIQNGKVFKNVAEIQSLKDERNVFKGKLFVVMAIGGFAMSIIGGLIVAFARTKLGI